MNVNVNDLSITSLETVTAFDLSTGNFRFMLDELQSAGVSQSQDTSDVTGKNGRKLNSLKRNKALTVSGTNGLVSAGLLEVQTGGKFETKTTTVQWTDYLTVDSDEATTSFVAVGTAGNEIGTVYVKNSNGTLGTALEQASTAAAGKFAYNPTTKKLSFNASELADGTEIVVFYNRQISASVHENLSDEFSEKVALYIDAFAEDLCSNIYRVQIYIPRADFSGNFELSMGDNQTVHAFEAESLAGAGCGSSAGAGALWTYTVFGADAVDA